MLKTFLRAFTFQGQLSIAVAVGILCLALFSSLLSSWQANERVRRNLIEQGQRITENLARQSALALLYVSAENAAEAVNATLAFPGVERVEIRDASQRVLLARGSASPAGFSGRPGRANGAETLATLDAESSAAWRFVAPVLSQPEAESPFQVRETARELLGHVSVVVSKAALAQMTTDIFIANMTSSFSFALLFLILIRFLTNRMTRPLNHLSASMARAESGESNVRAELSGPKDIADMAHAFNSMMKVLEDRETELRAARDKALEFARMKAEFAATVSHEIRTPMNGVIGMLDILKTTRLPREQREFVDVAWRSSQSLLELIDGILDFSKLEAGKVALEKIDFDLYKMIEEALDLFAPMAHQKGLELGYVATPEVPRWVCGDPKRLRQVIVNLISNAVKFTEHGEVAVRVALIERYNGCVWLRFEVADTGAGISPEAQSRIFESFSQSDLSTTRKYGGTGLGLSIFRQLVLLMGGGYGLDSEPGKGSRFWAIVPLQTATVAVPSPSIEHGARRVLIVEESEVVLQFLEQSLVSLGIACNSVRTAREALDALHAAIQDDVPFDLMIMDVAFAMAGDGELMRQVRKDARTASVRVALMDRFGVQGGAEIMSIWHADAYLSKPLRTDRLLECLRGPTAPLAAEIAPAEAPLAIDCRVLVVEDNQTNQMVVARMLDMLGCRHELAVNGLEALESVRHGDFGLILMDCSMPVMDGYEATARIRALEQESGRHIPIVAMTANTQPSGVEKCLNSGMDDHLPKPLTLDRLSAKIQHWAGKDVRGKTQPALAAEAVAGSRNALLDPEMLAGLREALGDEYGKVVESFLAATPTYLAQLECALEAGDAKQARHAAHTIKGSAGNFGAFRLAELAYQIERGAADGSTGVPAADSVAGLREEYEQVASILMAEQDVRLSVVPAEAGGSAVVLVVDDDLSTRVALRCALQRDGFKVEEAADGQQALDMMERICPDVVLMDVMMPVMDGFTASARLQELPYGAAVPVVMITALEDKASIERAFAAGASDYITKPIHFAVVSQRVRRIVEASRAERHVRHLAYNDVLTGLPNRAQFMDLLDQHISRVRHNGHTLAVLFLDLDRFKNVNDTLGHDVGDRLLIAVARRIRHSVRANDCVARFGGDEYMVLLEDLVSSTAASIASQKICRALSRPFEIEGHDIYVSTSIGISLYPDDGRDVGTLLKHADSAMYRAKKDCTCYSFYEPGMEAVISEHMKMEGALRRAEERNELVVFYQPQALLATGALYGMEALVRWNHPERGLVPPVKFIPLAEETGQIVSLGAWVLRTACAQAKSWAEAGTPLVVAVNLSGLQLRQCGFVDSVKAVLAETGLDPACLELEITESVLMEQAKETLSTLHQLKDIGVRLAIDDFGTGYSSLSYLKRFPVDTLKIDRSFVSDVISDPDDAALVTGIIALAHSLRLKVVAEGVEDAEQRDFLVRCGCDSIQGYLLGQPVPPEIFWSKMLSADFGQTWSAPIVR